MYNIGFQDVQNKRVFFQKKGKPFPLGATPDNNGFNFSIFTTSAEKLTYGYKIIRNSKDDDSIIIVPYAKQLKPRQWGELSQYGDAACCITQKTDLPAKGDNKPVCSPGTPLSEQSYLNFILVILQIMTTQKHNFKIRVPGPRTEFTDYPSLCYCKLNDWRVITDEHTG